MKKGFLISLETKIVVTQTGDDHTDKKNAIESAERQIRLLIGPMPYLRVINAEEIWADR